MSASIQIPPREMAKLRQDLLVKYSSLCKKDFKDIVNDKSLDWSFKAVQETERASAEEIAVELGQIGTRVSKSKSGQLKRGTRLFGDNSLAARIINARLRDAGKPLLFGKEMLAKVKKLVNARVRAVSFIKSGWLACVQTLKKFSSDPRIRAQANDPSAKIRGQPKGFAVQATQPLAPVAMITNTATKESPKAAAIAEKGLAMAAVRVEADMRQYIERKLQETANKI